MRDPFRHFVGLIRITDGDINRKFKQYVGTYTCMCGKSGRQGIKIWAKDWPKGVTSEIIEKAMRQSVEENHECRTLNFQKTATH